MLPAPLEALAAVGAAPDAHLGPSLHAQNKCNVQDVFHSTSTEHSMCAGASRALTAILRVACCTCHRVAPPGRSVPSSTGLSTASSARSLRRKPPKRRVGGRKRRVGSRKRRVGSRTRKCRVGGRMLDNIGATVRQCAPSCWRCQALVIDCRPHHHRPAHPLH
jgi:hypothetical protein